MPLITWNDQLSVNIAIIDSQHQKLVEMINRLHDAMKAGEAKDSLKTIVAELMQYTGSHFQTEERYFDQFGYSDTAAHKKEHADFVAKVSEFKDGLDTGALTLSIEVMQFLSNWLKSHIKGTDQQYVECFHQNGLK
jgi:hemerythrin